MIVPKLGRSYIQYSSKSLQRVKQIQQIQEDAQNTVFDDFESDFLDFSEGNPFGDMT